MPNDSVLILALALISIALVGGMTVLTLALSNGRALNRQLALVLISFLVINGVEVVLRMEGDDLFSPDVRMWLGKGLTLIVLESAWITFVFTQSLVGSREWSRTATRFLAGLGVGLGVAVLLALPVTDSRFELQLALPLDYAVGGYLVLTIGCTLALMWQARRQRISPSFILGINLLLFSLVPIFLPDTRELSLSIWLGAVASVLTTVGIIRLQTLNAYESERSKLAIARAAGVSLTTRLEMDALLDLIARQAAGLVGSPACEVYLVHDQILKRGAAYGLPPNTVSNEISISLASRSVATRRIVNLPDYGQQVTTDEAGTVIHAAAGIPLLFANDVLGVICVLEFGRERTYTDEDMSVLQLLAPQAAIAIDNAHAYAQAMQREQHSAQERDQLLRVHEAVGQMLATSDPLARLQVAAEAIHGLGWDRVRMTLFDEMGTPIKQVNAGEEWPPSWQSANWEEMRDGSNERYRLGVGYYVRGARDGAANGHWKPFDRLYIPLKLGDQRVAGVVELDKPHNDAQPTEESLRPLGIMAAQVAATLENSRLLTDLQAAKDALTDQVEELMMLQRVDQELNATLNLDSVMMLATDWSLRRTGARAAIFAITTSDGTGLIPLVTLGYPSRAMKFSAENPQPITLGVTGRAARTRQICLVQDVNQDPDYLTILPGMHTQIAVPMEMQGRVLGVISLESDRPNTFGAPDTEFITRLAARAAVALDNARLYREAEQRADEMSSLYSAGRSISSSLERDEIMPVIAQSIAAILNTSSAIVGDCRLERNQATILTTYRLGTVQNASERLPAASEVWDLNTMPAFAASLRRQRTLALRISDHDLSPWARHYLESNGIKSLLLTPLVVQNEVVGIALAVESRRDRAFSNDEILLFESLASQAAVAFRQVKLYEEVRELENLKSEMIRMASHDLRNPLGNVMGYLEVLVMQIGPLNDEQQEFVTNIRRSATSMKSLIDDLLTLEKVESERQSSWTQIDLTRLVQDTYEVQLASAALKRQSLYLESDSEPLLVYGSSTQLRQAVSNLINNAIKYTPEEGSITVRFRQEQDRLAFEVEDNGYGIAPERQARLFQRFYRAKQPGTDHIPGTGLGLSLVKTVINRHGGEVWVKSIEGVGSTFGFWLPEAQVMLATLTEQTASSTG